MIIGIDVLRINGAKKYKLIDIQVTGIRADPVRLLSASTTMGASIPGDAALRRYHRRGVIDKIAF